MVKLEFVVVTRENLAALAVIRDQQRKTTTLWVPSWLDLIAQRGLYSQLVAFAERLHRPHLSVASIRHSDHSLASNISLRCLRSGATSSWKDLWGARRATWRWVE